MMKTTAEAYRLSVTPEFRCCLVLLMLLGGCAFAADEYAQALARQQQAWREADQIAQECSARRQHGELSGYAESVRCSNHRMRATIAASGFPHMDLVDLHLAYRTAVGQRLDAGTLSEEDAELRLATLFTRINAEVLRRRALAQQAQQVEAQWLQSYGALLQGLGTWMHAVSPAPRAWPSFPQPITCHRAADVTRCY